MGKRMFIDYLEILGEQYTIRIHGRGWGNGKYILFMSFDPGSSTLLIEDSVTGCMCVQRGGAAEE